MKKGFKLLLVSFLIACTVILLVTLFTWLLQFVLTLFGAVGKGIIIFVIICALLTATVYGILEED